MACVHGLNGRPDLNAEHCVLTAFHDEAGRWAVRFTSGEEVRIKTANLKHPTPPVPTVTLLDLGHDMHAALVQSVGITYGLPALCAVAVHDFIPVLDVPKPVVGLVLSLLAMKLAKAINPPAAAYAAALSGSGTTFGAVLTGPGTLGAVVLIVVQQVYFKITDTISGTKAKKA